MAKDKKPPTTLDAHIGARLREMRNVSGLTQTQLGKHIGRSYQQIQKYERGIDRIPASVLFKMAERLGVDIAAFFPRRPQNAAGEGGCETAQTSSWTG